MYICNGLQWSANAGDTANGLQMLVTLVCNHFHWQISTTEFFSILDAWPPLACQSLALCWQTVQSSWLVTFCLVRMYWQFSKRW